MKFTFILRLMAVVALMTSLAPTKVEAFDFGGFMQNAAKSAKKFGKKAAGRMQKAAHGPLGQFALQAGGAAVSAKYGPEAGGMFQMASQSMHLADEHDAAADEADGYAQEAEQAGEMDTAKHHRSTAKTHRAAAEYHRGEHKKHKKAYEAAGGKFDDNSYKAVWLYELHLRYYKQALQFTGFPYYYHTIGSAFAVNAEVYCKQGGMNRQKAGEDFYFLQKIIGCFN